MLRKSGLVLGMVAASLCTVAQGLEMTIKKDVFGKTTDGQTVNAWTLENGLGMRAVLIEYGAILQRLETLDREGSSANIVLGFDTLEGYETQNPYFGCIVGRYANRIADARFTLDGKEYTLAPNDNGNTLHGGEKGFDKVVWESAAATGRDDAVGVVFRYTSADGEEGYPGELQAKVTYWLSGENGLEIEYEATTDKATVVNLTHHSYFNLAGQGDMDVLDHRLHLNADHYTPTDEGFIPTGEIAPVADTPFDFTKATRIGSRIRDVEGGYDLNYALNGPTGWLRYAARVIDPDTGRHMTIHTTEPGIQFYSGNFLDGTITGTDGKVYERHYGFCLETQRFPDTPNQPHFPSAVLRPGEVYKHKIVHRFGAE